MLMSVFVQIIPLPTVPKKDWYRYCNRCNPDAAGKNQSSSFVPLSQYHVIKLSFNSKALVKRRVMVDDS